MERANYRYSREIVQYDILDKEQVATAREELKRPVTGNVRK